MNPLQTPKISVLVAVYNVSRYLNECLDSLKNQTLKEAEFILVDDCSTDNSLEICNHYAESDSRFKIIRHTENKGLLLVRKTGIQNARGKFCIFLDGDDFLYSSDALEFVINTAAREETDLIYFQRVKFSSSSLPVNRVFNQEKIRQEESRLTAQEFIDATFSHKQKLNWIITSKCFRREVLERVSTFIPEKHLVCAEDAFLSFVSGNLIKNAVISKSKPIYAYRDDSGIKLQFLISIARLSNF